VPVDPEVQTLLDMLEQGGGASLSAASPEQARAQFRLLTVDVRDPATVPEVGTVEDIEVAGGDGPRPARVYRPGTASDRALPMLVFFHGGGFVIGDLDTHDSQARRLCRDLEALVVSVDYRLAPEHPFPAAPDDCVAATRWVADNAARWGGDPSRLAVGGDSAGGNLAAVVAQRCRDEGGPQLSAQLLLYPVIDLDEDRGRYPSRTENAEGYLLSQDDMDWFTESYLPDPARASDPAASPLRGELADLPPAVVVTAEYDPLRDEGDAYAAALAAAGVPVTHERFNGLIHGFFGMGPLSAACEAAVARTCQALTELWAPSRA
jgi:acetyl esterase